MRLRICERFSLAVPSDLSTSGWFLEWVVREPQRMSYHLSEGYAAISSISSLKVNRVLECFGGIGAQAQMVQDTFHPDQHVILENSKPALAFLASRFKAVDGIKVKEMDAFSPEVPTLLPGLNPDLIVWDCGDFTAAKFSGAHGFSLYQFFRMRPKALVLTDICGVKALTPAHRVGQGLRLGPYRTQEEYLTALSRLMFEEFGYAARSIFYSPFTAVLPFEPLPKFVEPALVKNENNPKGLIVEE